MTLGYIGVDQQTSTYCCTLQASATRRAFLKFLPDFSAILLANSGGSMSPSFLHVCFNTLHTCINHVQHYYYNTHC